ncbi:hypothetical protein [Streptomyces sp. NPDC050759]|uniref:hypothetical protein n=1 Tax=Streptomyces sp. NPDC050759 TaxID=3365635 RepID=UPI003788B8A2
MAAQQDQFNVWYTATKFPSDVRPTDLMTFSAAELAHALFVTGRAPEDRSKHGVTSVYEWIHRSTLIPAYIRRTSDGSLVRSDLARELDQSEKVSLSYALGQALTGIFSERVLSVRFLMHVDRYAARHGLAFVPGSRRRADFFGQTTSGGWVVAEAKGRSGDVDLKTKRAMRDQKRTISLVGREKPDIAYGCAAHFPKDIYGRERLKVLAIDPVEEEPEAIELPVDPDKFIQAYYEPFLAALDFGDSRDTQGDFVSVSIDSGIRMGVLRSVVDRVELAHEGRLRGLHNDVIQLLEQQVPAERPGGYFLDGTHMATKWSEALRREDWSESYIDETPWWSG